ncbi:MAG: hypothetical protein AAF958_19180, partial [Planctomycetota bacterium]
LAIDKLAQAVLRCMDPRQCDGGEVHPERVEALCDTVVLWPERQTLQLARSLVQTPGLAACGIFFGLVPTLETIRLRGSRTLLESALQAIRDAVLHPCKRSWVRNPELDTIAAATEPDRWTQFCLDVVATDHPLLYGEAIKTIADTFGQASEAERERLLDALRTFLLLGDSRDHDCRVRAAWVLYQAGEALGLPILLRESLEQVASKKHRGAVPPAEGWLSGETVPLVALGMHAATPLCLSEAAIFDRLLERRTGDRHWTEAAQRMLKHGCDVSLRSALARIIQSGAMREQKLGRIAKLFAEGMTLGRELTGRLYAIEMIGGHDLGYTRMFEDRIYINPIAVLQNVKNADRIVRGLILHEFGHHVYHRGGEANKVWEEASRRGWHSLLNLVADEHLERNFRARDRQFADWLGALGNYAFNRGFQDMPLSNLLSLLGFRACEILQGGLARPSPQPGHLRLRGGVALQALERAGDSYSRFFRALRLGLGNRHDDPKVAEALELFDKSFRHRDMRGLLEICARLVEIFGSNLCRDRCLGSDWLIQDCEGELAACSGGLSDSAVQREIRRILGKPQPDGRGGGRDSGGVRVINVGDDIAFDRIDHVRKLSYDANRYQGVAAKVGTAASSLRRFLTNLGVSHVTLRRQLRGRRLDTPQLVRSVTRSDPRILISRRREWTNDLFIGVAVDCSGSMSFEDNMEKAQVFAAVIAEAVRGLKGIDARFFGFTDSRIDDAGNADRPAIAALSAGGGNNDAAALAHVADVAFASRRRSRLLVMISDGLPTECSTQALKSLVARLSRMPGTCCAQVAVQQLEEVCFSHYIELTDPDLAKSARRFGQVIAKLIQANCKP